MTVKDTSSNKSNNTNNTCIGNNVRRTSIQYILNQDQNITSSLEYWEFHDNEGDDDDSNSNRSDNHNNDHYNDSYHLDSHLDSRDFQYSLPVQQYYSSHGKLVPPPPPSMEMDTLNDDQILSPDEFNSIFESFTTVVEGHSLSHNSLLNYFGEDGCMKGINCSNDLLDEEQLAKTLGAIAMI